MTHSEKNHEPQHGLGLSADEVLTTAHAVRKRLDLQRPVPRSAPTSGRARASEESNEQSAVRLTDGHSVGS
jgi:hypothetical protein